MNRTVVVRRACLGLAVGGAALALIGAATQRAQEGIEGTYRLVKRELPDGTTVRPPEIFGLMTYSDGHRNFNIYWTEDQKTFSIGAAAEYELSEGTYRETSLYYAVNDEIAGKGMSYDLSRPSGTSEITRERGRLEFQLPLYGEPRVVFERKGFTATRPGAFVDHWERVR